VYRSAQSALPVGLAFSLALLVSANPSRAVDLPNVGDSPLRLDATNFSLLAMRFDARTKEGEAFSDHGYGTFINRLNVALNWEKWSAGTRLDSAIYWQRPEDRTVSDPILLRNYRLDGISRFRNSIYPAKVWVTYSSPGIETTFGDAYAQFGRGLVLSMRKVDDLGIDTTLRGVKLSIQKDPIALTFVAGFANPSRVDEATGRALFLPRPTPNDSTSPQPVFGSDRIVGAELQAGRGLPVILSTHFARVARCAPYRYGAGGNVVDKGLGGIFGTCDDAPTIAWLESLPTSVAPTAPAAEIVMAGQSVEFPRIGDFGNLYIGVATQSRRDSVIPGDTYRNGNALYATYAGTVGPISNTLEVKSYRNFYPVSAAVEASRAGAFSNVVYSQPPTAEVVNQDSAFGTFNVCVNGGRLRTDVRVREGLIVYGQGIFASTKSEALGGGCDARGKSVTGTRRADSVRDTVWDGLIGVQWAFDKSRSYLYAWAGVRDDRRGDGLSSYREQYAQYTLSKSLGGPYSLEFLGRHRNRFEDTQNARGPNSESEPWHEGENYTAIKVAPKWIVSHGFEYSTRLGFPTYYNNGSILYKFTNDSNIRLFGGQQRGGLRCVSGVCRVFPAYEGVRVELTLRF
jgi:Family of unknown function (DUF6029)